MERPLQNLDPAADHRPCSPRPPAPLAALAALLLAPASPAAAAPQDAERQTHTDQASSPQPSFEARRDGVLVRQYQLGCLSHLSYLVVAGGEAMVIDPQRDVGHYLRDAKAEGAALRLVALTHPHADFVAGHTELAQATGAGILIAAAAHAGFPHRALNDGDAVKLGDATLTMWLTPGHTPDASTFLLTLPGASTPAFAFTGDTLFVGSIGRPDLLDVPPAELASQSFDSIQRLKTLANDTVVLPAHGAGSLCGAHLSPETTTTIGAEKAHNPFLRLASRASFVANVISHQPTAPQYFAMNVRLNRAGPPLVERSSALPTALTPQRVRELVAGGGWVVDVRDQHAYAAGHVPGSVNIALRGRLDTWMGIVVPTDADLVLVGDDDEVREGAFRLRRIGYDRLAGRLDGGVDTWGSAGGEVRQSRLVQPRELYAAMQQQREPMLIDVRSREEFADLRLGDIGNLPVTESDRFASVLARDMPVVMICNSAYRSSMAVGLAERLGFRDVGSLDGGLDAWLDQGLPVIGDQAPASPRPAAAPLLETRSDAAFTLPEPVDSALLARVLVTQPAGYAVFDLRPAWQFAEWHVPGSRNVTLDALTGELAALPQQVRAVLVDRDGSTAFAVAGALLARDATRDLRVLLGGVQAFYRSTQFGGGSGEHVPAGPTPAAAPTAAPTAPMPQPQPTTTRKRNAGC